MGILDDAIRQHLDLKRRLGADENDVQKLEDEAFGPPSRPGEPDFPERDDQVTGEQASVPASDEEPTGIEPELAPPPPPPDSSSPTVESPAAKPTTEEPAVPAAGEATEEPSEDPDEPPTSTHEPDRSVVEQPAALYDHTVDEDVEAGEASLAKPEPPKADSATAEAAPSEAKPGDSQDEAPAAADEGDEKEADGIFDMESLDLELDEPDLPAAPAKPAPPKGEPEPPHQEEPPPPEPTDADAAELGEMEPEPQTSSFEPEPSTSEQRVADKAPDEGDEDGNYEGVPDPGEEPGADVLDQTPEFLRDQPEDDELWFEQGEPKDFDF